MRKNYFPGSGSVLATSALRSPVHDVVISNVFGPGETAHRGETTENDRALAVGGGCGTQR